MEALIITAALTGAELGREQVPWLPISPDEIAREAEACARAGAAIVHVHARCADGRSTQAASAYQAIIEAVQQRCELIVQVSTGGAVGMSADERLGPVTLAPEMATLSMGSVNFGDGVFVNAPADLERFHDAMRAHDVVPEFEIFDAGMLATLQRWIAGGRVKLPVHVDFVLGVPGGLPGTAEALMYLRSQLPPGCSWTVAGIGAAQLPLHALAVALGGHVRVGFEDNLYLRRGHKARSNAEFVERAAALGRLLGREPATPAQARAMLGIAPRR